MQIDNNGQWCAVRNEVQELDGLLLHIIHYPAMYNVYTWVCEKQMLLVGSRCFAAIDSFVILISFIILSECKVKVHARQSYSALCMGCVFIIT